MSCRIIERSSGYTVAEGPENCCWRLLARSAGSEVEQSVEDGLFIVRYDHPETVLDPGFSIVEREGVMPRPR